MATEVNEPREVSNPDYPHVLSRELRVEGNKFVNDLGETVRLCGVNVASLEWCNGGDHVLEAIYEAFTNWNCNLIRLPMAQDRWFGRSPGQTDGGEAYRKIIDDVLALAALFGKYIELDLHWSNGGVYGWQLKQYKMPDMLSIDFWAGVASRYKNHPAALFNLYNEPRDIGWGVWRNGGMVEESSNKTPILFETPGHQRLLTTVRAAGARNIIIAGGNDWGYDLRGVADGYELRDTPTGNGVAYESHAYPWKPEKDVRTLCVADKYPIIVGEFGIGLTGRDGIEGKPNWMPEMLDWMDQHNLNFTAWCFHPKAGPAMLEDWTFKPNAHNGAPVKERLLSYPDTNAKLEKIPKLEDIYNLPEVEIRPRRRRRE